MQKMLLTKKKILSEGSRANMVTETKRWASDIQEWGTREGTKEAIINDVVILNKRGLKTNKVIPNEKVIIKAYFTVYEEIDDVHFGVAIFREDGVYCYGPNSKIDGLSIKHLVKGDGYFQISYKEFLLMPGIYYLSVAIWDTNEKFAYDYHKGSYKIEVVGTQLFGQLLCLPSRQGHGKLIKFSKNPEEIEKCYPPLDYLIDKWNNELKNDSITLESIKCLNSNGVEDSIFVTGRDMEIKVDFKTNNCISKYFILWLGIYRSDGIYCHGNIKRIEPADIISETFIYPELRLLPGGYKISIGLRDLEKSNFIMYSHGKHSFNMVSDKCDHGTVYMEHRWSWKILKGGKIKK